MLLSSSQSLEFPIIAFGDPWHDSAYVVVDKGELRHVEVERYTRSKYEQINPMIAAWMSDRDAIESARSYLFVEGRFFAPLLRRIAAGAAIDLTAEVRQMIQDQSGSIPSKQLLEMPGLEDGLVRVFDRIRQGEAAWQIMDHHFCHAANAFLSSSFDEAMVFTLDGGGAHFLNGKQVGVHGSVYHFDRSKPLSREPRHLVTDWSPGWAWTRISRLLGYDWEDAGTVMAMAAFGESSPSLRKAVQRKYVWNNAEDEASILRRLPYALARRRLQEIASDDKSHFGLACALQEETERRIREFIAPYVQGADGIAVCLSGGVFLNCVAAGKVARWFPQVSGVFIPPAPYDGGLAIGLAQNHMFDCGIDPFGSGEARAPFDNSSAHDLLTVHAACRSSALGPPAPTTAMEIAERIGRGEVVALFQGGSESGRRALGNRSIVADPRDASKRDLLNRIIKKRQWFRPFAPMILYEEVANWFDVPDRFESPYMSFAVPFLPGKGEMVPAVRHHDDSARVQTVHHEFTPKTHLLLKSWHEHSGVPILLNTSFNDSEPIVGTPHEAISTMLRSGIDGIYFADFDLFAANPASRSG